MKIALITGITGQDGSYLAETLLQKGYLVHGIIRRASINRTDRIDHLLTNSRINNVCLFLHYGDLTDSSNLARLISTISPDEIYNLGAQSDVALSFEVPEYTAETDALGTLRLLESLKQNRPNCRFYQASTSELYGGLGKIAQNENTPFYPRSPYAAAKLYAFWVTVNYREAYNLFACNGILFNHESPRRGENFVTRKITKAIARIHAGLQQTIELGNLNAIRDWGYAGDYIEGMWLMLQQPRPVDYVLASGEAHTVREFVELAFREIDISIEWNGKAGTDEKGYDAKNGRLLVQVSPQYFRPTEVDFLLGDPSKAEKELGWRRRVKFEELVRLMVQKDLRDVDMISCRQGIYNEEQ